MQYDVFADDLSQRTFVQEEVGEHVQIVERAVVLVCPVECEFVSAVRVIGEITGIHSVGYYEKLDIVE